MFCGALLFVAGCATAPNGSPPPNWSANNEVQKPHLPHAPKALAPVVRTNLPAARTNLPTTNGVPPAPVTTWTSLNRWAAEQKISAPHRVNDGPMAAYAIGSSNGVMVLEIGSQTAFWGGVEIHLGFDPQLIDNQVFVYGPDLQKNLEPLLCGSPLKFGSNRTIVIDPGHGGGNTGAKSVLDGRLEKEFTLDWAKRLRPLLETNGWKVFLTRTSDVYVTNSDRVVFAEARHADLFVSLHFNSAAPDTKQAGLETYCLTPTGMPSTLTRGYTDFWSENFPNNAFDAENLQLAVRLQTALLDATSLEDRGVRRARFIDVLHGQRRPAVLIEGGYLSNPHEAALIETPEFRQKLAEAVAYALK
jgi:N-acetylmuramoyl-L-alanine amidase